MTTDHAILTSLATRVMLISAAILVALLVMVSYPPLGVPVFLFTGVYGVVQLCHILGQSIPAVPQAPEADYGTWAERSPMPGATVHDSVTVALGDEADHCDLNRLVAAYRRAITLALPDGAELCDDRFVGPVSTYADDEIRAAVNAVDLHSLALGYRRMDTEEVPA